MTSNTRITSNDVQNLSIDCDIELETDNIDVPITISTDILSQQVENFKNKVHNKNSLLPKHRAISDNTTASSKSKTSSDVNDIIACNC